MTNARCMLVRVLARQQLMLLMLMLHNAKVLPTKHRNSTRAVRSQTPARPLVPRKRCSRPPSLTAKPYRQLWRQLFLTSILLRRAKKFMSGHAAWGMLLSGSSSG